MENMCTLATGVIFDPYRISVLDLKFAECMTSSLTNTMGQRWLDLSYSMCTYGTLLKYKLACCAVIYGIHVASATAVVDTIMSSA